MPIYLQSNNNSIQIEHRFPIFPQNIETDIPLQIDIRMINLLHAFHLRWVMREILIDREGKAECSALVHALVGLDREGEVEDVVCVREVRLHCAAER